jgi:hypothetical protein
MWKALITLFILTTPAFAQWPYPDPEPPEVAPETEREMLLDWIADERAARRVMPAEVPAKATAFCRDKTFSSKGFFLDACAFHGGVWIDLNAPVDIPETWKRIREIDKELRETRRQTYGNSPR